MRPGASWGCESSCRGRGCGCALTQLEELGVGVCVTVRSGDGNRGLLHAGTKTQDLTGHTWQGRPVTGLSLGLDPGARAAAGSCRASCGYLCQASGRLLTNGRPQGLALSTCQWWCGLRLGAPAAVGACAVGVRSCSYRAERRLRAPP